MAQFTSKSQESLASGMAGTSSSNVSSSPGLLTALGSAPDTVALFSASGGSKMVPAVPDPHLQVPQTLGCDVWDGPG